ncbi:hypothetical protein CRUP_003995 [Coryphaenoides rupestris]|nr:hypothetical protein CRUP_003995 [Coryphaenoides rupestris]
MFEAKGIPFILLDIVCLRGFFCHDGTIAYPFHSSTVTSNVLYSVGFTLPIVSMIVGEWLTVHLNRTKPKSPFSRKFIASVYKAVGTFLFGAAMSQSLTDIAKYSIGRLRPHFLDVLSFYSGHSSFSMYCMLFLALYLQARLQVNWARLLRPTLQFFLIAASVYTGLSRVSDYKHHWSDVLTGLLQGALMAILVVFCVSDFFKQRVEPTKPDDIAHTSFQESPTNGSPN